MPETERPDHIAAVIVAAGLGTRAGGDVPKQWQPLAGRRVIDWTLAAFAEATRVGSIVVVVAPQDREQLSEMPELILADGGETRAASVQAGLQALASEAPDAVMIHDAARACVTPELIDRIAEALGHHPAAAPGLALTDALWQTDAADEDKTVAGLRDRTGLYRAQTPQAFRYADIVAAHRTAPPEAADDVQVARAAGIPVRIVPGDPENLKITTANDFDRAARILEARMTLPPIDIRTGNGFDVHRFGPGDRIILCGIEIPHDRSLQGHSDADVGLHTISDAIYGALADGDIGRHFPPSDPRWKGADCRIFLEHAVARAIARGYRITHVDLTLICEEPKIGPHAPAMSTCLAGILEIDAGCVSVKATTTERLGFTGRGEGIAAMATVTLVSP